ncbi:MAG: RdgB/HAM1 family non-canonical purine NTP pyrophosphatase [Bdellovibrionaceae bacterium]|nr:RdgB/HAM1 family non-canonical purine NTP pyrophosphatase [Bdellovibrio sp.]
MEIWIATGNKGKLEEYKLTLAKFLEIKVYSQSDLPVFSAKPETGTTFLENARIKAKSVKALKADYWVLGEDSGLEVESLNHLPGVHSARYAGPNARDSENVAKLLKMMQIRSGANRQAVFKCMTVVYTPQNEELIFEGVLKGTISPKLAGVMGFGYDPVFVPEGETKTLAELGPAWKIQKSHRALALSQFLAKLKETTVIS